jgi:predicted Zn-dependent protease
MEKLESAFKQLSKNLSDSLNSTECFNLSLEGELSQFSRFNHGKVRQSGIVQDYKVTLVLIDQSREVFAEFPFCEDRERNQAIAFTNLNYLRQELGQVPENPYVVLPQNRGSVREEHKGEILDGELAIAEILSPVNNLDFTGFYAGGTVIRAFANSAGQNHWFATDSFFVDYSIFTTDQNQGQKAVKGTYSDRFWQPLKYQQQIELAKEQLSKLAIPTKNIPRGNYRAYFAPAATAEIIDLLRGSASESAIQQKNSALLKLQQGEKQLSEHFNLIENFAQGNVPRFNQQGDIAPLNIPIIEKGRLVNTLICSRTALEYGKVANGANRSEYLRSPEVLPGTLAETDILTKLDTGLYLSNLHYLNWSDRSSGRITGMTRYACFWVENGKIVAPIENLRFDDSIYRFLGENLESLTQNYQFIPDVSTYGNRSLGGVNSPGMIVNELTFTL